jgi:hypothetical protein
MQIMSWDPALCARSPVMAALRPLFEQFAAEEAGWRKGDVMSSAPAHRRLVDPSALRSALAQLPGQEFSMGGWPLVTPDSPDSC